MKIFWKIYAYIIGWFCIFCIKLKLVNPQEYERINT